MKFLVIFCIFFFAQVSFAWTPPPPTTFIPEYGKGFLAIRGTYYKVEEELQAGERTEIEAYGGGTYVFHGFKPDLAWGLGVEYSHGENTVVDESGNTTNNEYTMDVYSPTAYLVYTLIGSAYTNGLAITGGYSKMLYRFKDRDGYSINVWRVGLIAQYFLLRFLSIVPFIEWAEGGQTGIDLVLHLRGFQISIGTVQALFGKDDTRDNETKFSFGIRKTW